MGDVVDLRGRTEPGAPPRGSERRAARVRRAYHEAGHAVCGAAIMGTGSGDYLSITATGQVQSLFRAVPIGDRALSAAGRVDRIAVLLGGMAAEELVDMERSAGAGDDLARALSLARTVVTEAGAGGMSPASVHAQRHGRLHPAGTALDLTDRRARVLVAEAEARARAVIRANRSVVVALATTLAATGRVEGNAVRRLLVDVIPERAVSHARATSEHFLRG